MRGFSLIELLVTLAVVALLIGILVPALGAARDAARAAHCLSNLKQLATATTNYAVSNHQVLPQPTANSDGGGSAADLRRKGKLLWYNAVDDYLGTRQKDYTQADITERNWTSYKQDPAWTGLPADGGPAVAYVPADADQRNQRTYKMNVFFGRVGADAPYRQTRLTGPPRPADTVLFADGRAFDTPSAAGNIAGSETTSLRELTVGLRHDDRVNAAFLDGSTRAIEAPVRTTAAGYRCWFDETLPEGPPVIFDFRR